MFLQLTATSKQQARSESTAVQHSVARLRRRRQFEEGEEVVVYDNRTKLSSSGNILEVLGNNTYLADCGNGPKHVSGDLISKVSGTSGRDIGGDDSMTQEIGQEDLLEDDNMSISSESSIGSKKNNLHNVHNLAPQINNRVHRKRRRQVDRLGRIEANLPRLRPRHS